MGQSQGAHAAKQFSNNALKKFQEQYEFHTEKNDERWGVIQVWNEKATKNQVMIITRSFHNDHDFNDYLGVLKTRTEIEHESLVQFVGWSNEDADGICGHNRKFHLYVQYFSQNLEKEVHRRSQGSKEYFEEAELWYLGRTAVDFGEALQLAGISHGDYRAVQILLTESGKGKTEDGQVRLTDNGLIGLFKNGYNLTLSGAGKGNLSPLLMRAYAKKDMSPECNVYKADVYSLGMTLLQAATLSDPHKRYYDWITKEVNSNAIEKGLKEVESRYGLALAKYIASMLDEDELTRPDFLGLAHGQTPAPVRSVPVQPILPPVQVPLHTSVAPVYLPQPQPLQYSQVPVQQYPVTQSYVQPAYVQPLQTSSYVPPTQGIRYVSQVSPQKRFENVEDLSDLDRRVQEAIRTTEETINRNSQIPNLVETQVVDK